MPAHPLHEYNAIIFCFSAHSEHTCKCEIIAAKAVDTTAALVAGVNTGKTATPPASRLSDLSSSTGGFAATVVTVWQLADFGNLYLFIQRIMSAVTKGQQR